MRPDPPSTVSVYTLVVEVGRTEGDGLPKGCTGAGLLCYASGVDESEAVRETIAVLKTAGMAPLDVEGHGDQTERIAQELSIGNDERELMERAIKENAVVIAVVEPIFPD